MYQIQRKGLPPDVAKLNDSTANVLDPFCRACKLVGGTAVKIVDEDIYNTDGNGVILVVEREDGRFAEAGNAAGPFVGVNADEAAMPGVAWHESPNAVIEAWYSTFHDGGQLIRPNQR